MVSEKDIAKGIEMSDIKVKRERILGILNHISPLSETDSEFITEQLEKVDQPKALDRLVNAALDSSRTGLTKFIMQLLSESEEKVSKR
ncbi:MAG: hypothetical protein AAF639_39865 [Chloroflexota bacterium]